MHEIVNMCDRYYYYYYCYYYYYYYSVLFGVGIPVLMITVAIAEGDELLWRKQASVQKAEKAPKPYPHVSRVSPPYMCFHFTL